MERKIETGAPDVERTAQDTLMDMACSPEFSQGCIVPTDEEHAISKDEQSK